ncbi:leukocyte elastase inhibitor [Spodoptera frugiperda]|uniref:Leukocyte elastase inhibitor n=1 Tax=Spodoptera frugiperda TaxID=7108 RepID=A0A9R0E019_SPOFR|nr:leukocyte elastase inhibitor [Spodoptera frugiperda]
MRLSIAIVVIFASIQSLDCHIPPRLAKVFNSRLNYFDIDLLRYVAEGKSGNVMVSPASIKSTLAMLMEGAQGATAREIQTALRLLPYKTDYREQLSQFMMDLEINSSSVTVHNANGLFVSKPLQLKKEYEMLAKRVYFSKVNKLDFNDPRTAADEINGWVNSKTGGLIPAILDQAHINPKAELLLTSALYFKGTWLNEFDRKQTHGECFYRNGVCKTVAMMNLEAELNYAHVDDLRAHALELPYQNKRYSMMILMPQDRDAGLALIRDLPYIGLLKISNMLQPTPVVLTMPKFTVVYGDDMVAPLKNMGISTLFSPAANLSGIIDGAEAHLNTIFHKVYMSVDEKGTIAAAATADMLVPLMNNFVPLLVNRPFIFFIWDNEKGVVLFEGKIEEPTEFDAVTNNKFGQPENQPSQPTNQPIPPTNQPSQSTDQPSQPTNQPSQPTNQPSQPTNQPSQPTNQPSRPTNQRSQPTNQPIEPTNQPSQPTSDPSQSTSQPITEYSTRPYYDALPIGWFRKVSGYLGRVPYHFIGVE